MSLADAEVHDLIAKRFVCAWRNTEGDPDAGVSNRHPCGTAAQDLWRGTGAANVQTLVLTPDGRILHAISGYVSPRDLLGELRNALHTCELVWPPPDPRELGRSHGDPETIVRRRMKEIATEDERETAAIRPPEACFLGNSVKRDRDFVRDRPLLPIETFRTRMLTGGGTQHFAYKVSKKAARHPTPDHITRQDLRRLPESLQKTILKQAPGALQGDPTMISIAGLPKALRQSVRKRLERIRKREVRAATKKR